MREREEAFLTVIVTGNGICEWLWHAHYTEAVMESVNQALGEHKPFPIQFSFQDGHEWEGYSPFLEIID